MANTRLMLWFALAAILYLNYEAWMRDYREPASTAAVDRLRTRHRRGTEVAGRHGADGAKRRHRAPATAPSASAALGAGRRARVPLSRWPSASAPGASIHVVTDVLDLDINLKGGEIDRADLLQYPLHKDTPNVPVRLENRDPGTLYLLQTGFIGAAGEAAPTHLATWASARGVLRACPPARRSCACP